MTTERRYPGVSPFSSEQKNVFYGRDNDSRKLSKLISMRKQVLLFSKSGIGKTSLLNAGVYPKLGKEFTIIPIRFFAWNVENNESLVDKILLAFNKVVVSSNQNEALSTLDQIFENMKYKKTLWYYFMRQQFRGASKFILIFDQFEELFSYPDRQIDEFKTQIHELTSGEIPDELKREIAGMDEIGEALMELFSENLDIKTIYAIRSDRLSLLNSLTDKIPDIHETFYELKPLDEAQTRDAIIQPANSAGDFKSKAFTYHPKAVTKIIEALTQNGKQNIESTQLQIVCQKIEDIVEQKSRNIQSNEVIEVTEKDLPEFKDIFLSFYEGAVTQTLQAKECRQFIEEQLIRDKQRISLDSRICRDYVTEHSLKILVNTHLLRVEQNSTGGFSYELSHDTLIEPIFDARNVRNEKERKQLESLEHEIAINKEKEEARLKAWKEFQKTKEAQRQKRTVQLVISGASLLILMVIAFFFVFNERLDLQKAAKMHEFEADEAKDALKLLKISKIKNDSVLLTKLYCDSLIINNLIHLASSRQKISAEQSLVNLSVSLFNNKDYTTSNLILKFIFKLSSENNIVSTDFLNAIETLNYLHLKRLDQATISFRNFEHSTDEFSMVVKDLYNFVVSVKEKNEFLFDERKYSNSKMIVFGDQQFNCIDFFVKHQQKLDAIWKSKN